MPDIGRIILGSADLADAPAPDELLDYFVSSGGRRLDLANVYGGGESSRIVGRWLTSRADGPAPTLYVKGCHPPQCAPELVRDEVDKARSLLGVETLDNFILHRDDPQVDADRWAEALLAEIDRGAIGNAGVSNWTVERFRDLHAAFGHRGAVLRVFSNHLSLVEMVVPTWPGCLAMSAADARELDANGVEVIAWASLAAGFFTGNDPTSWDSDSNRSRRARAQELAADRGVPPVAVALAYVLHHPVYAAVGTRSRDHLRQLLSAVEIELDPTDVSYLEGDAPSPSGSSSV